MADSEPTQRPYNPYQDLNVNPRLLELYKLPSSPEYLFEEEALGKRRFWGQNLTLCTGSGYVCGAIAGGVKGTFEGLKSAEYGESFKVRFSRVLNSGGHTGRRLGNAAGMLGLIYGSLDSFIFTIRDRDRDTDDVLGSVLAGLGTGSIYRITSGVRSAAIAGALGGLLAGAAISGRKLFKRYLSI